MEALLERVCRNHPLDSWIRLWGVICAVSMTSRFDASVVVVVVVVVVDDFRGAADGSINLSERDAAASQSSTVPVFV